MADIIIYTFTCTLTMGRSNALNKVFHLKNGWNPKSLELISWHEAKASIAHLYNVTGLENNAKFLPKKISPGSIMRNDTLYIIFTSSP